VVSRTPGPEVGSPKKPRPGVMPRIRWRGSGGVEGRGTSRHAYDMNPAWPRYVWSAERASPKPIGWMVLMTGAAPLRSRVNGNAHARFWNRGNGGDPVALGSAGRKGRKDLARSLPSFKVRGVLFLGEVSPAFWPSKPACRTHEFRHWGVGQQYPPVKSTLREGRSIASETRKETQYNKCAVSQHEKRRRRVNEVHQDCWRILYTPDLSLPVMARRSRKGEGSVACREKASKDETL